MTVEEQKQIKMWIETWERAGDVLEDIKKKKLRTFDYSKNMAVIDEMLQWACDHKAQRLSSGLKEQQYWFLKMHTLQKLKKDNLKTK